MLNQQTAFNRQLSLIELRHFNQRKVLEDENVRLRSLLQNKDSLIQELTCKIVEFRSLQERGQVRAKRKLEAAREENINLKREKHKEKKDNKAIEQINWFRGALAEQHARTKLQYQQSLDILEQKQQQDIRELETNYQLLLKAEKQEIEHLKNILAEQTALSQQIQSKLNKLQTTHRQLQIEYDEMNRTLSKTITNLNDKISFLNDQISNMQNKNDSLNQQLKEAKCSHRSQQYLLQSRTDQLQGIIDQIKKSHQLQLAEQKNLFAELQEKYALRERNIELFGKTVLKEKPPQKQNIQSPTYKPVTIVEKYQRYIEELLKSLALKEEQLQQLRQTLLQYRKYICLEVPCKDRCDSIEQTGTSVKSLYQSFRRELKCRLRQN